MPQVQGFRAATVALLFYSAVALTSCGGVGTSSSGTNPGSPTQPAVPQQGIVVVVMEENHGYEDTIGNSAMPYFNSLAQQGALATQYYADAHPSIGNYFQLTAGTMVTLDDSFTGTVSNDNLVRRITAAGKTWKSYAEDLPSPGYLGGDTGNYLKHHDPFAYFSDTVNDAKQAANIVPFTQFAADMSAGALPSFSFVVPNQIDDAHSCAPGSPCTDAAVLARADQWLKSNIAPLLTKAQFQNGGLLLILFDEADVVDIRHGGGHVALVALGPKVKVGAQSTTLYQHENTLRTICDALGISPCPGSAATVSSEGDLLQH